VLQIFLYDLWTVYQHGLAQMETSDRTAQIFLKFLGLVQTHVRTEREVSFYADAPTNFALTASGTLSVTGITLVMMGLDVVAFMVGLVFGAMMKRFAAQMKYAAPIGFMAGYLCLASGSSLPLLLLGSAFIGIANGIGVPYLNTIGSVKAGKEAATTVMPLLSTALYLGQFLSPLIVSPIASAAHVSPYLIGAAIGLVYLFQAIITRKGQMLPLGE